MFSLSSVRRLALLPAWAACAALAQTAAPANESNARPDIAPPVLEYRSVFEGYRPFGEVDPVPWREANDTVLRRGGWRAYARESDSAVEAPSSPSKPDPHAGHSMHHGGENP